MSSALDDLFSQKGDVASPLDSLFTSQEPSHPDKKRSTLQSIQRPFDIAARGAAGFLGSLPREAAELGATASQFIESKSPRINPNVPTPSLPGSNKEFKAPSWFNALFPTYQDFQKNLQKNKPDLAKAETPFEKGLEKFGQALPGGAAGGVSGLLGAAGGAAGSQVAEEYNLPVWANLLLTGAGELGARGAHAAKNLPRHLAGSRPFRQTPNAAQAAEAQEYMRASQATGVDPLAGAMNPSRRMQGIQEIVSTSPGGYELAEEAYRRRSGQIAQAFDETLNELGQRQFADPQSAGQALVEAEQLATRQVERRKSQLYRAVDETIPQNDAIRTRPGTGIQAPQVMENINEAIRDLDITLAQSHPESRTYRAAQEARQGLQELNQPRGPQLLDQHGNPIGGNAPITAGVRQLEQTQRSLRKAINYRTPGGADKLLNRIDRSITETLDQYGRTNPAYAAARHEANEYFRNNVVQIRQNIIQSFANGEIPERALSSMNTQTGVQEVRQALSHLPHGNDLFNSLARFKIERDILEKVFDPNTGLVKTGALQNMLNKDTRHVYRELMGARGYERLEHLQHVGRGLEKGFNAIKNPSQSGKFATAIKSIFKGQSQLGGALVALATGNLKLAGALATSGVSAMAAPRILGNIIYSPEFANHIFQAAEAGYRGNGHAFLRYLLRAQRSLDEEDQSVKR